MRYEASVERANSVLNFIKNNRRSSTGHQRLNSLYS